MYNFEGKLPLTSAWFIVAVHVNYRVKGPPVDKMHS